MPLWDPLDGFIYTLGRTVRHQIITFSDHPLDINIRDGSIQPYGIPVLFILMIAGQDSLVSIPQEIPPLGIHLDIQMDESIHFISP